MSQFWSTNQRPNVYPFNDKPPDLQHNSTWENKKQSEEKRKANIQSDLLNPGSRTDKDLHHVRQMLPGARYDKPNVQSPGSGTDEDLQHGRQAQYIGSDLQSPRSGTNKDLHHGRQGFSGAQYDERSGYRTNADIQNGRHRSPGAQYDGFSLQSPGSRTDVDLHHGRHGFSRAQYDETPNLDFYQNKKRFEPNGVYIEELLTDWKHDYKRLEVNHSYIQWLFPLRQPGRNPKAKPLTQYEIEEMKKDTEVMNRFLRAYELMLGFYGIKIQNKETGSVERHSNYRDRFQNLNSYTHNNLRITRILKCLALLGYEHFQVRLVMFFLDETLRHKNLKNVKSSVSNHFLRTVKDEKNLRELKEFEEKLKIK